MADLADLRLDKPSAPTGVPTRGRFDARVFVAALVVLALVASAVYLVWLRRGPAAPANAPVTASAGARSQKLPAEAADDIAVPPLDESDGLVRQLVSKLSQHPLVAAWLTTEHLIRNFAVVVQNIADRELPNKHLTSVRPTGSFAVVREGQKTYIDPASYRRYDAYADAFAAFDARSAAKYYATLKPRISEAFRDLGDPKGDADATLKRAIVDLLATPAVDGRIPLSQPSVMYSFEDSALQSLSPAQRQLLRMGPRNVRIVQHKLREIAPYLGIDLSSAASR